MDHESLENFLNEYEEYLKTSFENLWTAVPIDPALLEPFSVIGGLLSRQVTLSLQLSRAPSILNGHSAPLFLRAMTDLHIALSWIMLDLEQRAKKYIAHGLGEEKLLIEHFKAEIAGKEDDPDSALIEEMIERKRTWLNSQKHEILVEVNLGNWAQLDYRKMSQEADCESLYKFAYKPFSHVAHNMWPHVSHYNLKICNNPLHRHHLTPELLEFDSELDYLYRSCKYVDKSYKLFVEKFDLHLNFPLPIEWWSDWFSDMPPQEDDLTE